MCMRVRMRILFLAESRKHHTIDEVLQRSTSGKTVVVTWKVKGKSVLKTSNAVPTLALWTANFRTKYHLTFNTLKYRSF